MNILVLNGSPRRRGHTSRMVDAFREGAKSAGHAVRVIAVAEKDIHGCRACEYCHTAGHGRCIQRDGMDEVYAALPGADMLVIASPIYYHGLTGQMKCAIDRLYAAAYPEKPPRLAHVAMFLSSGADHMYDGALFSLQGDFADYLGLTNEGVFTACGDEPPSPELLGRLRAFGASLP